MLDVRNRLSPPLCPWPVYVARYPATVHRKTQELSRCGLLRSQTTPDLPYKIGPAFRPPGGKGTFFGVVAAAQIAGRRMTVPKRPLGLRVLSASVFPFIAPFCSGVTHGGLVYPHRRRPQPRQLHI